MCSTNIYTNNNATRAFTQVGKRVGVGGVAGVNQPPYIYIVIVGKFVYVKSVNHKYSRD